MKSLKTFALAVTLMAGIPQAAIAAEADKAAAKPAKQESKDIVDTAVAAGTFKTLAKALEAADLVTTLKGKGPFTVFAPTDAAFAKLPPGTVEGLLKDLPKLKAILTYHVVAGKVTSKQVVKLKSAKTVQGCDVAIQVTDGSDSNNLTVQLNETNTSLVTVVSQNIQTDGQGLAIEELACPVVAADPVAD